MPSATKPDSRSPSPTPAPPIAETPGPRAQGLINVFNQAVKATLDKCSGENFASCFPTAAQYSPDVLNHLRSQIVEQLDRTWKSNFEDIMARRDVVKRLNSLDLYIEDAKKRKNQAEARANGAPVETPVPPHTLSPSEIYFAHLMPFLEKQAADMNSKLSETQQANAELLAINTAQRAEIETLVRSLESVVQDLEVSAQMMAEDDIQELGKDIKELETEMKK